MLSLYFVDHADGRYTYKTVEAVASALVARGGGPVGVLVGGTVERELTQAELSRLGHAVRSARAQAVEAESESIAASLGLMPA